METVCVDAQKITNLKLRLESLRARVCQLQSKQTDKSTLGWIDGQDVMTILNIGSRTLQTYRDNGTLPYSQVGAKIYYKPSDVESILQNKKVK